jgi:phospholipid/cholesterol/gamma-HCH transport system substrate-binding protein
MTRKILVGMLLLGALIVFCVATFYVKNWQFYLGKGYRLHASFPAVNTLDIGDIVRMAGVPVGTVQRLDISTQAATTRPVEAVLWIRNDVTVRAQDTAMIRMTSVFGGSYVAIERGDPNAPVLENDQTIAQTEVSPSVTEVIEQSKVTLAEIQKAVQDVTVITGDLREHKGTLGKLLGDEEFYNKLNGISDDVSAAAATLKTAAERLDKGEGVLGRLLMDDKMAQDLDGLVADIKGAAENIRQVSAEIHDGKGTIGKLVSSDELYNRVNDIAKSLHEGDGVAARLLNDPEMADQFGKLVSNAQEAAANLRDVTAKVSQGDSTVGKLLSTDEAYVKLDKSLNDLNEFTAALRGDTGTIGKLVNSDEGYQKLMKLVESVQGIVDTYREQSPVISVAGTIFGAF